MSETARYGCVRFEDPHQHNTGWASIDGEPAFRIKGTENLPSDVLFIINLNTGLMWKCGFNIHSRFRSSEYLSLRYLNEEVSPDAKNKTSTTWMPYNITALLGIDEDDWPEQVRVMSILFGRIMRAADGLLGMKGTPCYSLDYGLRKHLLPDDPVLDRNLVQAIDNATVTYTQCEVEADVYYADVRRFVVGLPRASHGLSVLNTIVPFGDWRLMEKRELPSSQQAVYDWVREQNGRLLAQIAVEDMDKNLNKIFNFGSGHERRRWVTSDELLWLSELATLRIKNAYICEDIISGKKLVSDFLDKIKGREPYLDLSISMSLLIENIWGGVSKPMGPPAHIIKDGKSANMLRPFYKATDLRLCLDAAITLQSLGVYVISYGKGKITFLTDKNDEEVARVCQQAGVIPPGMALTDTSFLDLTNPRDVLLGMTLKSEKKLLLDTDLTILDSLIGE